MNLPRRTVSTLAVLLAVLLAGCGAGQSADDGRLRVVATTGQLGDAVVRVGGDRVHVDVLMGPGVDPHLFVASEGDVDLLQRADVIFYNGLFLEAQMADVLRQLGERKPSVAAAEAIDPQQLLPWANYADEYDPHVWFDVTLWQQVVGAIGVAKENGIPWIGVQADQSTAAPETVMASAIYDWKQLLKDIIAKRAAGTLGGEVLQLTYANGGIRTIYNEAAPAEAVEAAKAAEQGLADGSITIVVEPR